MATALGLEKDECLGIVAGISWKMMNWGLLHYLRVTMEMHIYKLHWILNPTIISINLCCFLKELQEQKVPLTSPAPLRPKITLMAEKEEGERCQDLGPISLIRQPPKWNPGSEKVNFFFFFKCISHFGKATKSRPIPALNIYIVEFDKWMNRSMNYHTQLLRRLLVLQT